MTDKTEEMKRIEAANYIGQWNNLTDIRQPTHRNVVVAAAPADRIGGGGGLPCGVVGVATQSDALREALRNIQIEAEREKGSWVHLKRVIALNCKAALKEQSK